MVSALRSAPPFIVSATETAVAGPSNVESSLYAATPFTRPVHGAKVLPVKARVSQDRPFEMTPPRRELDGLSREMAMQTWSEGMSRRIFNKRQSTGASAGMVFDGYPDCTNIGNTAASCYPISNTTLVQNVWSKFIWNPNMPDFVEAQRVDVYLYNAGSEVQARKWTSVENIQGQVPIEPSDAWWESIPRAQTIKLNQNLTHPYFFIVVPAGRSLSGGESHQPTFAAIQTSPPSSVLASMTSASLASASALALSSARAASSSTSATSSSSARPPSLQGDQGSSSSSFPKWAIAIMVVLGFLLLLAFFLLLFFFRRRSRERRKTAAAKLERTTRSPSLDMRKEPIDSFGGSAAPFREMPSTRRRSSTARSVSPAPPPITTTRLKPSDDAESSDSGQGPFSVPEAAALADAFRQAMRKPDFESELPEESSSPESATTPRGGVPSAMLKESLQSETSGSIRTVDDRKGYTVQSAHV